MTDNGKHSDGAHAIEHGHAIKSGARSSSTNFATDIHVDTYFAIQVESTPFENFAYHDLELISI